MTGLIAVRNSIRDFLRKYDVIQEILNKAEKVLNVLNNKNNHSDSSVYLLVYCIFLYKFSVWI